ncbi:MAG: tyrosine-type recombinase/integrase [Dermatophilaceae bacterium]
MAGRYRVRVSDPLEGFAEGFRAELATSGYAWRSVEAQLGLVKHLSEWLGSQDLTAGDLSAEVLSRFVDVRRQSHTHLRSPRALVPLLDYLRGLGVAPPAAAESALMPAEVIEQRFARYLSTQRALAPSTVSSYRNQVRPFLARFAGADGRLASLTAGQVRDFVTDRAAGQRPRSVAVGLNALRALLRWMWREQLVSTALDYCVGSVAAPTRTTIPRALSVGQVADLFQALPAGPARLRNEPMLALMHRLGLRAGEVASLRLQDIDWRVGVLTVRGKGARRDRVPLPADVGRLLAAYLRHGRPTGTRHREVFLALDAPHHRLTGPAVSSVAARALAQAGIPGPGAAHRLRHTAACGVLAAGGGLTEAGELLRHNSIAATAVYARCDLTTLATLTRPWPTGAAR